jgi:hypothetical protein
MSKELYYFRKKLGLCVRCGKKAHKKITLCLDCQEYTLYLKTKTKVDYKERYKRVKKHKEANNLCLRCNNKREGKYKICTKCRLKIKYRLIKKNIGKFI